MSLKKIARNQSGDDVLALFNGISPRILSDDWTVYAKQDSYQRMVEGKKAGASLTTYSLMEPSLFYGFATATFASACMTETTFFRLLTAKGVPIRPVEEGLRADLRYTEHEHGERITIFYASEEAWSKRFRDRSVTDEKGVSTTVLRRVKEAIGSLLGSEPFVWMGNKDLDDNFFGLAGAKRLPNTPHGLNSFQGYHNVVVVSALNPPPVHFHFMETRGISGEELRTGCYRTAVYQAVMRCSIRNPADENPKRVIVMDRDTADWLADLFPGAIVEPLPGTGMLPRKGKAGRPRRHADDAAKARAYREGEKRKLLAELDAINGTSFIRGTYPQFVEQVRAEMREFARDENPYLKGDIVTPFASPSAPATSGTVFRATYDRLPLDHVDHEDDDVFIAGLRDLHTRVVPKEEAGVFSPAHFDPDKASETFHGLANVTHLRGIWLDNDGGDLTHAAFADLFPYLRIVVWNTASSTTAAPRWRAFIPTSHAMSMEVQGLILAQIVKVLNRAGLWGKRQIEKQAKRSDAKPRLCHGFDEGKFNAASMFYLPCQAKDPADSFFIDYGEADPKRGPLDLVAWIEHCILDLRPEPEPMRPAPAPEPAPPKVPGKASEKVRVSESLQAIRDALAAEQARSSAGRRADLVEKAVQGWRRASRGDGHAAFFRLGAALHRAGLSDYEIEQKLRDESIYAHSRGERRAEIKGILKSLSRSGSFRSRR
ncbi:hypothetical protein E4V01_25130 [Methylorubrum sp. Q1]|uniref:hypothetical protein n=1 Tax=Methylorubrum sp. Q1 TaxID=2562453 RepID=UPI001076387F|nr:hypothetical protein [Methylorubrum sp. Q1]TFZ54482.1 hypothetical protein E4V01_25130 [Methylorubrum sp. Q1]